MHKPGQRRFTEDDLPRGDEKRAPYELGRAMLEEAGYEESGMAHFALRTDSLCDAARKGTLHRNFMGYTSRHVAPLFGIGVCVSVVKFLFATARSFYKLRGA